MFSRKTNKSKFVSKPTHPNDEPSNFIKKPSEFMVHNAKVEIYFAQDNSGSQSSNRFKKLLEGNYRNDHHEINCSLFGHEQGNDYSLNNCLNRLRLTFNTCTYVASLNRLLESAISSNLPFVFVIQGDGQFSDAPRFYDCLERLARNEKLHNLRKLVFIYSPHTTTDIKQSIRGQISRVLIHAPNAIEFVQFDLVYHNHAINHNIHHDHMYQIPNIIEEIETNTSACQLPKDWMSFGDILAFHRDLTPSNIAHHPLVISNAEALKALIIKIMKTTPEILSESKAYIRLHNVLKKHYATKDNNPYVDEISYIKNKLVKGSPQELALSKLLAESFTDDAQIRENTRQLEKSVIGHLVFDGKMVKFEDILAGIRDGSMITLVKILEKILKTGQFVNKSIETKGMIVLKSKSSTEECRLALSTMFTQWGSCVVQGKRLFIMGLSILVCDEQIPKHVGEMIKKAILHNPEYSAKHFDYDLNTNRMEPKSVWITYSMAVIAFKSLSSYGDLLFPGYPDAASNLLKNFSSIIRVYDTIKNIKNSFTTSITYKNGAKLSVGDICSVAPFDCDPQINLPSVVMVQKIEIEKGIAICEYLDRPERLTEAEQPDVYRIKVHNLSIICKNPTAVLERNISNRLIKMQEDGTSGKLGEAMKRGASLNNEVLDGNLKLIRRIVEVHGGKSVEMEEITKQVTIPITIVITAIIPLVKGNESFYRLLLTGNRPNYDNILECAPHGDYQPVVDSHFKYRTHTIKITKHLIKSIQDTFESRKREIILTQLNPSNYYSCCICLDNYHNRYGQHLACHHGMCNECYESMNVIYQSGDFLEPARHRCPICRVPIKFPTPEGGNAQLMKQINTEMEKGLLENNEYRICTYVNCWCLFPSPLECGATREHLPDKCIVHRYTFQKNCPGCDTLCEWIGGCDHMTCPCGEHWCMVCLESFETPGDVYKHLEDIHGTIYTTQQRSMQ
jgi:hypothetical protein